jgi:molybdopterin-guanine dinucleotide biosynthesis protein A
MMCLVKPDMITGLVLAGGRGSRMGNVDKGLQTFRGVPMLSHVLHRLAPQVGKLIINANRNLPYYLKFGLPVWPDELSGFPGPLAGLQTGLLHCDTPYLVTAPCDSPFLPENLVARLSSALVAQEADLAVAVTEEKERRQTHPVFCMVKTSQLPQLTEYLQNGGRAFGAWQASLKHTEVCFEDGAAFCNINTAEDLRRHETT